MQKKLALSFLMTGLISTMHTPSVQANDQQFEWCTTNNIIAATLAGLLSPYMYKCWTEENPQTRYDLDELRRGERILSNLRYFIEDAFYGTPEINEGIKLKGENGKELVVELKPKRAATGLIGKIHAKHKKIFSTAGFLATILAIVNYKTLVKKLPDLLKILKDSKESLGIILPNIN